jgi:hypothetical protein
MKKRIDMERGEEEAIWDWEQIKEVDVRVLEAVAAARAPEELLGEADVAAHGADRGCGGDSAGHVGQRRGLEAGGSKRRSARDRTGEDG